jgi:uncharacterized protein (DUF4415 family)
MFHVEHFVDADMYVHYYAYNKFQMKRRQRVSQPRRVACLEAAAWYRPVKQQVSLRLEADVLAWFKREGPGYQTRINRALRKVMQEGGVGVRQAQVSKSARPGAPQRSP